MKRTELLQEIRNLRFEEEFTVPVHPHTRGEYLKISFNYGTRTRKSPYCLVDVISGFLRNLVFAEFRGAWRRFSTGDNYFQFVLKSNSLIISKLFMHRMSKNLHTSGMCRLAPSLEGLEDSVVTMQRFCKSRSA